MSETFNKTRVSFGTLRTWHGFLRGNFNLHQTRDTSIPSTSGLRATTLRLGLASSFQVPIVGHLARFIANTEIKSFTPPIKCLPPVRILLPPSKPLSAEKSFFQILPDMIKRAPSGMR